MSETVEVVIKIPKKCKEFLDNGGKVDWLDAIPIIDAIAKGTALPKGHGRLIDVDKFIDALFAYGQADDKFKLGELIKYTPSEIWEIEKILAKTVIEADREAEDD